ncbi:alpha-galactosidase [Dactylosporangium sp. NPDC050588]|uniref:alpha-galactosidase n=1 Tax=Dactylosporangium sp. NPDC050588 TaxID=3157211 RepID=UPI0033EF42C4
MSTATTLPGADDAEFEAPGPRPDARADEADGLVYLEAAGVGLALDCRGRRLPRILHWGRALTRVSASDLEELALLLVPATVPNSLDVPAQVAILPEQATGWFGLPGLRGHRDGRQWSPRFDTHQVSCYAGAGAGAGAGGEVVVRSTDAACHLSLEIRIELTASGVLRVRAVLRNTDAEQRYTLDGLVIALPVPNAATELLDLTGRWGRERSPQRRPFSAGTHLRDGRRGRTGSDAAFVLVAGEPGFGFRTGQVWGVHVGWSGNHRTYAERLPTGESVIGGGELLHSGELRLAPGATYESPWVYAAHGDGLDALTARFHDYVRARPQHVRGPRPVVANTWEAVYFDHNLDRLTAQVQLAAEVGVERFVLDDGWFRGRLDDRAGLGDWFVDETRWPQGLHPLVDLVRSHGMQFGLWVEPEMVSPDSDLARAHPDWIIAAGEHRLPPTIRYQQALDLCHPAAYEYVLERLDALVGEYRIAFLKWDHNRDLIDARVHGQTLAVYRLLDELRARHPGLEIESCSSGGARVDLGVLERTDRVWASDCIDGLERQAIQRWTTLLLPPELIGSHVGSARSHTTGRTQSLAFRAGTALFGHFGIEWDLTAATPAELAELRRWVQLYQQFRGWLHSGRTVRVDHPDPALWVHGVVSADAAQALFAMVAMTTAATSQLGHVRIPGLDPAARYRVRPLPPGDDPGTVALSPAPWLSADLVLSGQLLAEVGLSAPPMHPEQLLLLHFTKV